ncbi:chromosome segregation protein SMC [Anaerophilus nitritogenes]|uniref:chromosome segregation protein SMC n=1 Tax=Anaerophilus nitritogenes TaxID=2498136 RepID=UPI00101BB09E|nr:chromosome segregation protein SMC [Anaerophilus nitritogenes]
MYLKKIELQGFKSFANKIQIDFEKGVTGIVGPNGSGKSNISDAIRWVLGEQSAKTLRGSRMDDVIFAGTTKRKPVGMAEVSLTLSNEDGKLPVDYTEITVTRRVYRSGESEYSINKSLCRLKDVRELFMDTGVGVDGYSIIGQGKIDEILNNKSGNRRLLFEEAAGIVKYRTRKEDAQKKLENTTQNLIRIDDIIKELKSRIDPLKIQSEKAKSFLELQEKLKDLEINLFVHEMENLKYEMKELQEQKGIILDQFDHYSEEKKQIEKTYDYYKKEMEELETSIAQLQNNIFDTLHFIEKKDGEIGLYQEKIHNNINNIDRLNKEIEDTKKDEEKYMIELEGITKDYEEENKFLQVQKKSLEDKLNVLKNINQVLKQQEDEMENEKTNVIEILNEMASYKTYMQGLINLQKNMIKRKNQIEEEKNQIQTNKNIMLQEKAQIENILKEKDESLNKIKKDQDFLQKEIEQFQNMIQKDQEQNVRIKENIQQKTTRKSLLEEMEKEYEGFHKSVKNTLVEAQKNEDLGNGIKGVVAKLLKVPKGHETAIEVALGSSMQNIVCQKTQDANKMIQHLKKNNLGRVTFLPMDRFLDKEHSKKEIFKHEKGFMGFAVDIVSFPKEYKNIFEYLLGRIVLVDDIKNGIILSKKIKYKIVSLDGDVINPSGAITGGSYHSKTLNILSRKTEIEELNYDLDILYKEYDQKNEDIKERKEVLRIKMNQLKNKEQELKEKEIDLIHIKNKKEQFDKDIKNYEESIERIYLEMHQLEEDTIDTQNEIQQKEDEIKKLQKDEINIKNGVSSKKEIYEDKKIKKEEISQEVTQLKIKIASLEEKKEHMNKSMKDFKNKLNQLKETRESKKKEIESFIRNKEILQKELDKFKLEIKDAEVLKKQCQFNMVQEKEKKNKNTKGFEEVQGKLKNVTQNVVELQDSSHKIEVKLARLEMQQESFYNKLLEEYEMTYMEALEYKKDCVNIAESGKEIKNIKKKIKELGTVHVGSIEEYKEVLERYEFLTGQKDDLKTAIESLEKVIKEMEHTMKDQFYESFTNIKMNFNEVFQKLFGGGKAELLLENEEDLLNSGIEIVAQPPGKKLQNLSLLSGGERALTAISLLFAILKVKPTPFCILDEIEAALDDANVYRYANFLKEFSKQTQFIVVTHRKGTMESVDALYGVTMQEHGVSTLVSVKLEEQAS